MQLVVLVLNKTECLEGAVGKVCGDKCKGRYDN